MRTPFTYSYDRFFGLLEDRFSGTIDADSKEQALLLLVADMADFSAATESEAMEKAATYLAGADANFLEVWDRDEITCYRDLDIQEEIAPSHAQ